MLSTTFFIDRHFFLFIFHIMGKPERDIISHILLNLPENRRLFRINSGTGWVGETVRHTGQILILKNPRPLHAAPSGFPDLIGWETIEITPDMVGQKIAVFTGIEIKTGNQKIRPGSDQEKFRDIILRMGGRHKIISSLS